MLKIKFLLLFALLLLITGCDAIHRYLDAKQSINNMSLDTIIIFNSLRNCLKLIINI
jgi:uncharacterized protein YceK